MLDWYRKSPVLVVLAVFAALVSIVDPIREIMTRDDGWAYARSVECLLKTGEYHLDAWSAASMPVQIYFAAGLAHVFGYSMSLLRVCTLILCFSGAIAFYGILREFDISRSVAAALTVALICSPLVLWLAFTFMTDVQFLGWMLLSCWLCMRGLRRENLGIIFLGSVCAALAIGTRQFGVAIPVGLFLAWGLSPPYKRCAARLVFAGATVPIAAFFWQVWVATQHPTFTQSVRLAEQSLRLSQPPLQLGWQALWRVLVLFEYTGLFLAALTPALLLHVYNVQKQPDASCHITERNPTQKRAPLLPLYFWSGCLIAVHASSMVQARGRLADRLKLGLMPVTPWVISTVLLPDRTRYRIALTVVSLGSAAVLGYLLFRVSVLKLWWIRRDPVSWFFTATVLAFAALHVIYVQFQDTYFIVFLPFALLSLGHVLRHEEASSTCIRAIVVGATVSGIVFALWMRGDLNRQEVMWRAAEEIRAADGIDRLQVGGNLTWLAYHGGFDEWIADMGPAARPTDYANRLWLFFFWADDKRREAEYILYTRDDEPPPAGLYETIKRLPYRDGLFRLRMVYVAKRMRASASRKNEPVRTKTTMPPLGLLHHQGEFDVIGAQMWSPVH